MYMLSNSTGIQVPKHSASCLCILTKLTISHTHGRPTMWTSMGLIGCIVTVELIHFNLKNLMYYVCKICTHSVLTSHCICVNSLHPAQWLISEHMISIATTLEANKYEDAKNPNTDDCKVLPMSQSHAVLAELQLLPTKHLWCPRVYC